MLIVRTPVRISFAGGGTDLPSYYQQHDGRVLSAAINKYFYTVLTRREDQLTQIISADLRSIETCEDIANRVFAGGEMEIPFAALKLLHFPGGANLFLASEIPPGTGLGSSAAVCVNVLKALSVHLGLEWSRPQLAENAFFVAREILGRPVGKQDEYAAACGGLNVFHFAASGVRVEPVSLSSELLEALESHLMLFFTGTSRNSTEILAEQDCSGQKGEAQLLRALDALKALVLPMRDAVQAGHFTGFGELLHEAWELKKRFSSKISNSTIDDLYALARTRGALGGKITGAGGGGFLLLCCEPDKQPPVRQVFLERGIRELHFRFDLLGSRVVFSDPFFDSDQRGGIQWKFLMPEEVVHV